MECPVDGVLKKQNRKKKSVIEEDPQKSPEKNKKNEPFEYLESIESLNIERPYNKPNKRTKDTKTALQTAKNDTPKHRKAKE